MRPGARRHRSVAALLALAALGIAGCGTGSSSTGASLEPSQLRRRAVTICSAAADATASVATPTNVDELAAGTVDTRAGVSPARNRLQRLRPPTALEERFAQLTEHVEELSFQLRLLEDAAQQEPAVSADQLAAAQEALTGIDEAAAALDVPECASDSWGRAHVDAAILFVATQLPMPTPGTGDFLTDASAACGRFYGTFASSPTGTAVPTDAMEYAVFLDTLEDAYNQLVIELAALTAPQGSEAELAEVVELLDLAAKAVDRANRDPSRYAEVERALGAIGSEIGPRVRVLGFEC